MIRVGIAGIGFIAEEYIKQFTSGMIPGGVVTALSSRNRERMALVRERYQMNAALFTDYEEMLKSGLIDMVMICTPHFHHPGMAIRALNHGLHTLIEKPVGVFPEELKALTDCAHAHPELKCGVLYCRRTNPVFTRIKGLLEEGALGALKRVTWIITDMYRPQCYYDVTDWRGTYAGEGGGLLMNQVSHHIDMLVWLCGLPEKMQAHCYTARDRNIEVENEVSITMDYPGNAIGQFIASTRECPGSSRLEISGSRGQIILEGERELTVRMLDVDERKHAVTTKVPFGFIPFREEKFSFDMAYNPVMQAQIVAQFLTTIREKTAPLCPVEEAVMAQQFIQAAYLSSWLEKKLPLPTDDAAYTHMLKERITNG